MPGRILVFSPHPDDVELFLGGTVLRHLSEGDAVRVVMMTDGEKGSVLSLLGTTRQNLVRQTRREEMRRRLALSPGLELTLLHWPDMGVRLSADAITQTSAELKQYGPTSVYLPESTKADASYTHPDHLATGAIVEAAVAETALRPILRRYHSRRPNVFVDVSAFHAGNLAALRCYASQYAWTAAPPCLLRILERQMRRRARECGRRMGSAYGEAFREQR